jgi:hypothetical protein
MNATPQLRSEESTRVTSLTDRPLPVNIAPYAIAVIAAMPLAWPDRHRPLRHRRHRRDAAGLARPGIARYAIAVIAAMPLA